MLKIALVLVKNVFFGVKKVISGLVSKIAPKYTANMDEFVLKNNHFEFDYKVKKQISGTAIGTKFAPPYACIFMDKVEREFLEAGDVKSWAWFRYINDIFFICTEGKNKFESFLQRLNTYHPNLKFTHEKSKTSVNFLYVAVRVSSDKFETDLYSKATDCHQFLEFNSAHPIHIKKSIAYSQGLPIKRLCLSSLAFEKDLERIRSWFEKCVTPRDLLKINLEW